MHIWIRRKTEKGYDLLLQKRSKQKDSFPGCYDISSAGHISAGDEPLETAIRELEEELGIKAEPEQLKKVCMHEGSMNGNFYGREFKNHEISTVYMYEETVDITGIVLTKLDGTAKGGAVIGIVNENKVPVKFIGVGEQVDDMEIFNSEDFVKALI